MTYHLYGVINKKDMDWGYWPTRAAATDKVGDVCAGLGIEIEDIFWRDDPHHHREVLVTKDGSARFFIDRGAI